MNIYNLQECLWKGVALYLLSSIPTRFTDTKKLAGQLLQRAHLCTKLAAGREPGTFAP